MKIMIQWANLTPGQIPWWVGCQAAKRGSRFLDWHPVEDAVNERVNHDPDIGGWWPRQGRDHGLVVLGRTGLPLFEPGPTTKFDDGGIGYELEIPDAIAHSRDLAEVQDFLLDQTMTALTAIARRLRTAPPPTHTADDLTGPPVPRGRLADIATKHGAGRPLVLISPRYRHRPRFDQLKAALAADEVDIGGWAACSVNPDATAPRVTIDTEFDLTGIARPFEPDTLLSDTRIACLLIANGSLPAQREHLEACAAVANDHIPVTVTVAGNDGGVLWAAAAISSPATQGSRQSWRR